MHLTPEQRAIGKENAHVALGQTRRDFLQKSLAATVVAGAGLGSFYYGYAASLENPVRLGIIGTGDEGNVLIGALNPKYVQVVAIADIRPYSVHRAFHGDYSSDNTIKVRPGLMSKYGWKTEEEAKQNVQVFTDGYDKLLDMPEVEGVIIALPLHLHDEAAIKAMRKGKHVLTEKLMAHSVRQCKEMSAVAKQTGQLLAVGHQRHYSILYDNAVDMIRRGLIGDIHHIRAQWHRDNLPGNDSWAPLLPPPADANVDSDDLKKADKLVEKLHSWRKARDKAQGKEMETWQKKVAQLEKQIEDRIVNAENYGYETITLADGRKRPALEELIRWRLWNRTGGGLMAELGSHQLDASGIFVSSQRNDGEKMLPLSVTAVGGRHIFPLDRDCDDHVYCLYEYPGKDYYKDPKSGEVADPNKKIVVSYSSINGNGYGGYGETVMGTAGTLLLEKEEELLIFKGSSANTKVGVKNSEKGPALDTTASGDASAAAVGQAATAGPPSRGYMEEIEHWAYCIREQKPIEELRCNYKVALADAVIALTTNLAIKQQQRIDFKKEWFDPFDPATPEGTAPRKPDDIA